MNRLAERPRQGQGLQGRIGRHASGVLDEDENHYTTPILRIISTTAGAAPAPVPSTSARLPRPGGTTSRTISRRGFVRAGVEVATGFFVARMRPGTEG